VETILVSLVSLALIIVSFVSMEINTLQSTNKIANSLKQIEAQSSAVMRTNIMVLAPSGYTGGPVELTVRNDGQTNLSEFTKWDVIVQYQTGEFSYLTYSPVYPANYGQWTVKGIYVADGSPEIFDPGILDPGEQMVLSITLDRNLNPGQSCEITVSTPNGVKSQSQVTGE
jgi:hypothetical protein